MLTLARDMHTLRSSIGWRITSSAERLNSGNSSRKSTPLCASDISPGWGMPPPPTNAASEIVWCGLRNGRCAIRDVLAGSLPATECILVVSNASCKLNGGNMVGSLFASMVLPAPGGPMSIALWPPAAAISSARFTFSYPFTSLKSISKLLCASKNSSLVFTTVVFRVSVLLKKPITSAIDCTP